MRLSFGCQNKSLIQCQEKGLYVVAGLIFAIGIGCGISYSVGLHHMNATTRMCLLGCGAPSFSFGFLALCAAQSVRLKNDRVKCREIQKAYEACAMENAATF